MEWWKGAPRKVVLWLGSTTFMPTWEVRPKDSHELTECPCANWKRCFILWAHVALLQGTQFSKWGVGWISALI